METKTNDQEQIPCSTLLKTLADETRLSVVQILFEGPCYAGDLMRKLDIEQSLLSHHLKLLRDSGIVESERDGKAVLYRLAPEVESRRKDNHLDLGCCELSFKEL